MNEAPLDPNLEELLACAPESEADDLKRIWALTSEISEGGITDPTLESRVREAVVTRATSRRRNVFAIRARRLLIVGAAAAVAFLAVRQVADLFPRTVSTLPGQTHSVPLPDGSSAMLEGASSITFRRGFGRVRSVRVTGHVYFDVVTDRTPFRVETFNANVEVVGTAFGVRARPGGYQASTIVSVDRGRVRLTPTRHASGAAYINAGEARSVDAAGQVSGVDGAEFETAAAWREGNLVYRDQYLGIIFEDLESLFGVSLEVRPRDILARRVSLSIDKPEGAEAVVRTVCTAYGLSYARTATGFELFDPEQPGQHVSPQT